MTGDPFPRDPAAIDLSALDPTLDPAFQAAVAAIVREAMGGGASGRQGGPAAALVAVARWTRPILAAAAAVVAIAFSVLERARVSAGNQASLRAGTASVAAERLGMPESIVSLAAASRAPTPADVVAAFDATWTGERR